MWQILKSEIEYNKYVLITVYAVAVFFFVAGLIEDDGFYGVVPNTIVPFFIGFGFLCHKSSKESRERQHSMLPQSRTEYGLTRMVFFALFTPSPWVHAFFTLSNPLRPNRVPSPYRCADSSPPCNNMGSLRKSWPTTSQRHTAGLKVPTCSPHE